MIKKRPPSEVHRTIGTISETQAEYGKHSQIGKSYLATLFFNYLSCFKDVEVDTVPTTVQIYISAVEIRYSLRYNISCGGDSKMTIDEILKTVRKELNLSQEALARELSVSFTTLNRWENNKSKPSRLAMIQIRDYCKQKGVSAELLSALERI